MPYSYPYNARVGFGVQFVAGGLLIVLGLRVLTRSCGCCPASGAASQDMLGGFALVESAGVVYALHGFGFFGHGLPRGYFACFVVSFLPVSGLV